MPPDSKQDTQIQGFAWDSSQAMWLGRTRVTKLVRNGVCTPLNVGRSTPGSCSLKSARRHVCASTNSDIPTAGNRVAFVGLLGFGQMTQSFWTRLIAHKVYSYFGPYVSALPVEVPYKRPPTPTVANDDAWISIEFSGPLQKVCIHETMTSN
jgi:hypothetical protein